MSKAIITPLVDLLKTLAHPARLRILAMLRGGPLCVCQVSAVLAIPTSTASEHLTDLRRAGFLSERKDGRWVSYALQPDGHLEGILAALWAVKFDHLATVTNFVIMPLTFLSGTFYSVARMPEPFRTASRFNPLFYLIDGFRYGFIGRSEQPLALGAGFVLILAVVLGLTVWRLFAVGYRLKT